MPTVGVVTVTYNSESVLDDFLDSIVAQQGVGLRVYAVDNASSDGSVARLGAETRLRDLRVIANSDNLGVATGNNQGIEAAMQDGCDWVLLLNNDTLFSSELVVTLVRDAEQNGLKLVAPLIEATEPARTIWYAGGRIRGLSLVTRHTNVGKQIGSVPVELAPTGYASTCCLLVHPEVFSAIGLMEPTYFVYFDDVDFAIRAIRAGFRYWLDPAAHVVHKASALTGGKESPFTVAWTARNWPLTVRRNRRGVARLLAMTYIQVWILGRMMLGRDSLAEFRLREQKFRESLGVPVAAPPRAPVTTDSS